MASVVPAAAAALAYLYWQTPWGPIAGLAGQLAWHVMDGADGDLARRTGRASPVGELVDGVCDHLSQVLIYLALASSLARSLGGEAWLLASVAGAAHFLQANAYETGRKTYRRWVYGAAWMRQTRTPGARGPRAALAALYIGISSLFSPGEATLEAAMENAIASGPDNARTARGIYREAHQRLVKASGVLDSNTRTLAVFFSMLCGSALWFFLFEAVVLTLAAAGVLVARGRCNRRVEQALAALASSVAA